MNKLLTAAVVGGAALAVGVLPAASTAAAATAPTPIPVPVVPSAPAQPGVTTHPHAPGHHRAPTHHRTPGAHKPGTGQPGADQPVDGKPHGGKSHGGKAHGGKSHGGKSKGGKSKGGKSRGGKPVRGKSHGGSHGGKAKGGKSQGGRGHGKATGTKAGKPGAGNTVVGKPGTGKPGMGKPGAGKVGKPGMGKPGKGKPVAGKPVAGKPAMPVGGARPAPGPIGRPIQRILGGTTAGNAPWAAQVMWDDRGFECSGAAIAPQWVLTAKHCVGPAGMTVLIGSPKLGEGTRVTVDDAKVDPTADLALLHLADSVDTGFLPLADKDPKVGSINQIYGWGKTDPDSGPAEELRSAKVKVTSLDCVDSQQGRAICSTGITGTAFNGDSGGPEIAGGAEVGVCSTGDDQAKTQQYASVAANRDWIREVANA